MEKKQKPDEKDLKTEVSEAAEELAEEVVDAAAEELPDTEIIEEDEVIAIVEEEEESLRDQFVRLQADFANFRNRTQRERIELYQRANEDLPIETHLYSLR